MYEIVSKVAWAIAQPAHLVLLTLCAGVALLWTRWPYTGRWLASIGASLLIVAAVLPLASWIMQPLEDRFPALDLPSRADGIIVLGGATRPTVTAARGRTSLGGNVERLISFATLAKRYPTARLVFLGGSGRLGGEPLGQADVARTVLADVGLDVGRVIFEGESKNTYENALFGRDLVLPAAGEVWILITSASHMPRAVGVFRRLGWPVVPYPVGYRTGGSPRFGFRLANGLSSFSGATKEWVGLLVYRILGRSSAVFPGPEPS